MSDKKYVGSGKKAGNYDIVNISVCLSDLPKEDIFEYNGKKYIKLTVAAKREADQYGKTHTVYIDEFKPKTEGSPAPLAQRNDEPVDDLPWK